MHIYFLDLAQLKDLLLLMLLKPKKGATMINTPIINSSLWQLRFLDASTNKLMCFYTTVHANWSFRRLEGPPLSILVTFFHKINFNYITNDASILHLKLGNSNRFGYFSTSTHLGHNPHRHG
jgi:hypothetical protein